MAIEREEIEVGSAVPYERTRTYSVDWPLGHPLPSLDLLRERFLMSNGVPIFKNPDRMGRSINVAAMLSKSYTIGEKTITGMEYMEFTKLILDGESQDWFAPIS